MPTKLGRAQLFLRADAPLEQTANGAVQSALPILLANIPPEAMFVLGAVLGEGVQKYCKDGSGTTDPNMRAIDVRDHLNHVLVHIYQFLGGATDEDHLGHALARLVYAVANNQHEPYCAPFKPNMQD
jgi:hypothetical protein